MKRFILLVAILSAIVAGLQVRSQFMINNSRISPQDTGQHSLVFKDKLVTDYRWSPPLTYKLSALVSASSLRDFRDTTELEQFLELGKMTTLLPDRCKENVDQFIRASGLNGYKVERFRIASPDYYRYWLSAVFDGRELKLDEGHGVAWVLVDGRTWLIEPTQRMAWEWTDGSAGKKVGIVWE